MDGEHSPEKVTKDGKQEGKALDIDPKKERKLVRKLDLHIIPLVMLLYLLSFIDRYTRFRILLSGMN